MLEYIAGAAMALVGLGAFVRGRWVPIHGKTPQGIPWQVTKAPQALGSKGDKWDVWLYVPFAPEALHSYAPEGHNLVKRIVGRSAAIEFAETMGG